MAKRIEKFDSDDSIFRSPGLALNDRISGGGYSGETFTLSSMPPQVIMTNADDDVISAWFPSDDPNFDRVTILEITIVLNILNGFDVEDLACPATTRVELAYNDYILDRINDANAPEPTLINVGFNAGTGHPETTDIEEDSSYSLVRRTISWETYTWDGVSISGIGFADADWPSPPSGFTPIFANPATGPSPPGNYCELLSVDEVWHKTFTTDTEYKQVGASSPDPDYNALVEAVDGVPGDVTISNFNYSLPGGWPDTGFTDSSTRTIVREITYNLNAGTTPGFPTNADKEAYWDSPTPYTDTADLIQAAGNASGTSISDDTTGGGDLPDIFLSCQITVPSIVALDSNAYDFVAASDYAILLRLNVGPFDC